MCGTSRAAPQSTGSGLCLWDPDGPCSPVPGQLLQQGFGEVGGEAMNSSHCHVYGS